MRSTWPYLAAVVAVGVGAGVWIAGIPQSGTGITVAAGVTPGGAPGGDNTVALLPTSSFPPITVTPTTEPARNPVPPITAAPTTTTAAPATTTTTTTTTTAPNPVDTTVPAATATTAAAAVLVDRAEVRLVIANGDGRFNLVGRNVDRLTPLGYTTIDQTDASGRFERTVLYIRPGFDDEAARLAADLSVPDALIEPLPEQPITINDELGDIVVVLGPDAVR